ncbi:hypothetical protein H0A36_30080 [Endozoicomonas sp. SM1973]|uniref:Uncharacterized protein n=1 Tax=Spartinivicinus marinus TaxID=2994442 RepID=A0A853IJS9_9GAMM|nr:hypothetical protein [Spartinivicinus marinus]MCX4025141.1 hypothetical protein [Spartinivicinus marinus]NYZ70264.1 hypothetical protein [Spartinivicinus marinus]
MKVEQSKVTKIKLTDLERLDPITVFLEDFELGKGKITIECYGKSWSSYWPGMGGTIAEFFIRCDEDYLISNLSGERSTKVAEGEDLQADAKQRVIKMRRNKEISSREAKELFEDIERLDMYQENYGLISQLYGDDDWIYNLPEVPNPDYQYLCRIIKSVQAGLKEIRTAKAA